MSNPLVSICIPTYNGAAFLEEALESVKTQTYSPIEVVVSDDASTDNTLEIVAQFKKEVAFPVTIVPHKPNGIGANWNNCVKHARGKYIKFLFQDDILLPQCVEEMTDFLENNPNTALVACKRKILVENNIDPEFSERWVKNLSNLQKKLMPGNRKIIWLTRSFYWSPMFLSGPVNKVGEPSVVMFQKSWVKKIGVFDTRMSQMLDIDYWYRLLAVGDIAILNQTLAEFRLHGEQATVVNSKRTHNDAILFEKSCTVII